MEQHKFEVGQRVIYEGLIAIIEKRWNTTDGKPFYSLVAEENKELSCSAQEEKCELYIDQEIDQSEALFAADMAGLAIMGTVGKLADKYFRDGCH
jgi:hypothetical protein